MAMLAAMRVFPVFIIMVFAIGGHAQPRIPDSLSAKPYLYFREMLDNDRLAKQKLELYADTYLAKAKAHNDWEEMVEAYKGRLYVSAQEIRIQYADSMIHAAIKSGNAGLIGSAYLTKGITYYGQKNHQAALENYLLADSFISQTKDFYLIYKLKYNLAQTKYFMGMYESSLALLKECVSFYEKDGGPPWLNSLHHQGLCYTRLGKYDLSSAVNELGMKKSLETEYEGMYFYFEHSEGINQFHRRHYELAIAKLRQSLPELIKSKDVHNETVAYYYIARCFYALGQPQKAIPYLLKIDDVLIKHNHTSTDLKEGIKMLKDYYTATGDLKTALRYSDHLQKADSILDNSFKNVSNKVHTANDARIASLETGEAGKNITIWSIGSLAVMALASGGVLYRRNRKLRNEFQRNYEQMIENGGKPEPSKQKQIGFAPVDISPEKEAELYANLESFEHAHLYLGAGLTQMAVAKMLHTNPKYLTYIIRKYRNKLFVRYINDLKSEYAYRLLTDQPIYRNYDQQSFAEELGFGTAQNLRRAFRARYGFSTPFYIEQLEKQSGEGA